MPIPPWAVLLCAAAASQGLMNRRAADAGLRALSRAVVIRENAEWRPQILGCWWYRWACWSYSAAGLSMLWYDDLMRRASSHGYGFEAFPW